MTKDIGAYIVHSHGEVFSKKSGRFLKNTVGDNGYALISLYEDRVAKKMRVHQIVAKAFIPNPHGKRTVNHKDGNKLNNNVANLEWATDGENIQHAYDNSLIKAKRVLSFDEITEILHSTVSSAVLEWKYGVSSSHINGIRKGKYLAQYIREGGVIPTIDTDVSRVNSSGISGVSHTKGKWAAYIHVNGKRRSLGVFVYKLEAVNARKEAEMQKKLGLLT